MFPTLTIRGNTPGDVLEIPPPPIGSDPELLWKYATLTLLTADRTDWTLNLLMTLARQYLEELPEAKG